MPEWLQRLNENWYQIIIPVAIIAGFIIGGRWLRRIAYNRFNCWARHTNRLGLALFISRMHGPFLFWFVLLGIYVATRTSILTPETIATISTILLSLFVSCWVWLSISICGGIVRLYLPKIRQRLARIKAPQPPTNIVTNGLRVVFIIIGAAALLNIWELPNINGLLVLIATLTIGILALREASFGISKRVNLNNRTRKRLRSATKVLLSILVLTGVADIIRRIYVVSTTGLSSTTDLIIPFLEIGFVIWFITILRSSNYHHAKPSVKLVTALSVISVLIIAFTGVQPFAEYKDVALYSINTQANNVNEFYTSQSSPRDTSEVVRKVIPAIVRLEAGDYVGTGMIIDKTGYVLTCYHLVEDNRSMTAILHDGKQYNATFISGGQKEDLAIVKINVTHADFPIITIGNPDELEIGQEIILIGYALGLEGETSISKGIVSAFRSEDGVDYVQTDAAVNPGCSGGPLLNLDGEVMGVVSSKVSHEEVEGMGFAVLVDTAEIFINDIVNTTEPTYPNEQDVIDNSQNTSVDEYADMFNQYRKTKGLNSLEFTVDLNLVAELRLKELYTDFSHYSAGNYNEHLAENIAMNTGFLSNSDALEMWRNSPGHNANMLDSSCRYTGYAIGNGYAVQVFTEYITINGKPQLPPGWYWVD